MIYENQKEGEVVRQQMTGAASNIHAYIYIYIYIHTKLYIYMFKDMYQL